MIRVVYLRQGPFFLLAASLSLLGLTFGICMCVYFSGFSVLELPIFSPSPPSELDLLAVLMGLSL